MRSFRAVDRNPHMFGGFSAAQGPLEAMLESMAGSTGGSRDALTRYTRRRTDAYYFVSSIESLRQIAQG